MAIRVGVYGILVDQQKVLMVRTQSGPLAIWNFPGGGVDAGENDVRALTRECHEELGAMVIVHECLYAPQELFVHPVLGYHSVMRYYRIALASGAAVDYAVHGATWFSVGDLPLQEMLSVDQEVVRFLGE